MTPAQKLIAALFDPADVINLRVIADGGGKANNTLLHPSDATTIAEAYPAAFPCIAINPRKNLKTLATIKNLAIDIDGAPLPEWAKDHADIICSRDETHHHVYLCFAEGISRAEYKDIAARLIAATPGADKAVSDPERVLRLPGFAYNKKGVSGDGYKIAFTRKKIERLPAVEKFKWLPQAAQQSSTVEGNPQPVAAQSAAAYIKSLYLRKEKLASGDGRSRRLWFVGIDCHSWGIPLADALALAHEINATFTTPEEVAVVVHQVQSAYKYAKADFGQLATKAADSTEAKRRVEQKAFERAQKVRDMFAEWVYVHSAARFCDSVTSYSLASKEQIEGYITQRIGDKVSLHDLLARDALACADRMEFDPARTERTFKHEGLTHFNAYSAPREAAPRDDAHKKTAVKIFKEHVGFIASTEEEEKHLMDYFAYCVQNKGKKVDWTPLIISEEGLGKSVFYKLFAHIFGEHNCAAVSADNLLGGWTHFMAQKLFVVSHEVKMKESHGLEKLKNLISEDRVEINGKHERIYDTKNCANFLLLSNESDALRLTMKSRRFFVIFSRSQPRDRAYYNALFAAIENGAGWIEDYLLARDLSAFSPHGPAPKTEGLRILAMASRGDGVAWIDEQAADKRGAFDPTKGPFITAAAVAADAIGASGNISKYVTQRSVTAWLAGNGYRPVIYWAGGASRRGWFKGDENAYQAALKELKEKVAG